MLRQLILARVRKQKASKICLKHSLRVRVCRPNPMTTLVTQHDIDPYTAYTEELWVQTQRTWRHQSLLTFTRIASQLEDECSIREYLYQACAATAHNLRKRSGGDPTSDPNGDASTPTPTRSLRHTHNATKPQCFHSSMLYPSPT